MPTLHGETLQERYARERAADIKRYSLMTGEQIEQLVLDLNSAMAQRDIAMRQRDELMAALRQCYADLQRYAPNGAGSEMARIEFMKAGDM